MILGMSMQIFTLLHVILSLAGIGAGPHHDLRASG